MVCHEKSKSNFFGLDFLFVVSNGIVPWALAVRSIAKNVVDNKKDSFLVSFFCYFTLIRKFFCAIL